MLYLLRVFICYQPAWLGVPVERCRSNEVALDFQGKIVAPARVVIVEGFRIRSYYLLGYSLVLKSFKYDLLMVNYFGGCGPVEVRVADFVSSSYSYSIWSDLLEQTGGYIWRRFGFFRL